MLQGARKAESRSFLRELDFSLVLIESDKARKHFLNKLSEINARRNDPHSTKTGERDTKSELLAYLGQKGYTQTANVWARALSMDRGDINELLKILQVRILEEGIEGVLEIHLQDREINSPHIQFVGIDAQKAEVIIAQTLVELKYETSIESALSKKDFMPYYKINQKARYPKHNDLSAEIAYYKGIQKKKGSEEEIEKLISAFDQKLSKLKQTLDKTGEIVSRQSVFEAKLHEVRNSKTTSFPKLRQQKMKHKIRRLRRAIR